MTPEEFEALSPAKRAEAIEQHDEFVRQWRGVCQRCRRELRGTRHELREHVCDDTAE